MPGFFNDRKMVFLIVPVRRNEYKLQLVQKGPILQKREELKGNKVV